MSIIVWQNTDGSLQQGMPLTDFLVDIICNHSGRRYFPGGRRIAYRVRINLKGPLS